MRYRGFGRDGLQISEVGLGTWQLGSDWGKIGDEEAQDILREAFRQGIVRYS